MGSIDVLCDDPDHIISGRRIAEGRFYTEEEWKERLARTKSQQLPGTLFEHWTSYMNNNARSEADWETLKSHFMATVSKSAVKNKYNRAMFQFKDNAPALYQALISIGAPKLY